MSTVPGETAVVCRMSKQHAAAPSDYALQGYLALPDVQYYSSGKKPVAIVFAFFRVCDVDIFNFVINQNEFYGSSCSFK